MVESCFCLLYSIIKLISRMEIRCEDSQQCVRCWTGHSDNSTPQQSDHLYYTQQPHYVSTQSSKMSLKKLKTLRKQHQSSSQRIPHQEIRQMTFPSPSNSQPPVLIQRPISQLSQQRPQSQVSQKQKIRVTFNRESYKGTVQGKKAANIPSIRLYKNDGIQLELTAKICKAPQVNRSQLFATKKVIPGSRFSLQQLSHMKKSVQSIIQGQQKAKIEQSTILMDFFNPSNSRLADLSFKSRLQRLSPVFSQQF